MNAEFLQLPAPKRLALAYAGLDLRDFLGLVLRLDERLASVLQNNRETLISQMRIAWWNDVIAKPAASRPKGEPLLALLGEIEAAGLGEPAVLSCGQLLEAWECLLVDEARQEATLARHAQLRGEAIFGGYARLTEATDPDMNTAIALGAQWAAGQGAIKPRLSRALRPLSILAKAAGLEQAGGTSAGIALSWHALTGR